MFKCNVIQGDHRPYNTLNFHNDSNNSISNLQPPANYLELTSNYVQPNPRDDGAFNCFPFWSCRSNSQSAKNKPTILSRSDGSGLIIVGSLQATIPSSNAPDDDEGLRIVPSATHKSYVDIVK